MMYIYALSSWPVENA